MSQADSTKNNIYRLICRNILNNRIELKQYFQDYDKLNKGFIRKDQFIQVLDKMAKISQIPGFDHILTLFEQTDQYIRYLDFLDDLDKFFYEGFEQSNQREEGE